MGMGAEHPVLGYAALCGVKLAGYTLAGRILKGDYPKIPQRSITVGGVRTLIGMAFGLAFWSVSRALPSPGLLFYAVGLGMLRLIEWWLVIWIFFDRALGSKLKDWGWVAGGTLWSFALDVPATLGFLAVGGFYVC